MSLRELREADGGRIGMMGNVGRCRRGRAYEARVRTDEGSALQDGEGVAELGGEGGGEDEVRKSLRRRRRRESKSARTDMKRNEML